MPQQRYNSGIDMSCGMSSCFAPVAVRYVAFCRACKELSRRGAMLHALSNVYKPFMLRSH